METSNCAIQVQITPCQHAYRENKRSNFKNKPRGFGDSTKMFTSEGVLQCSTINQTQLMYISDLTKLDFQCTSWISIQEIYFNEISFHMCEFISQFNIRRVSL